MAATAKVIELKGNPSNPESAEHIIKFPGGSISVCRTTNNEYWAHIEVNDAQIDETVRGSMLGEISRARLDYRRPPGEIKTIGDIKDLNHIAVRIRIKGATT